MSKVEIVLNEEGIRELLKSSEVAGVLEEKAKQIIEMSDGEFTTETVVGKRRCWVSIKSADTKTYYRQLRKTPNVQDAAFRVCGGKR